MIYASATEHKRTLTPAPSKSRRRCHCGCKTRATHIGQANGCALMSGCELHVRRWVRDGVKIYRRTLSIGYYEGKNGR